MIFTIACALNIPRCHLKQSWHQRMLRLQRIGALAFYHKVRQRQQLTMVPAPNVGLVIHVMPSLLHGTDMCLAERAWALRRARRSLKPAAGTGQRCCELSGPPARCVCGAPMLRAAC